MALSEAFWLGVDQFNQREFYACHDTLEALWIEAMEPEKKFYQGILQVAVGFYHLENHNWRGAAILLGEGMSRLQHYQPEFDEIDVTEFLEQTTVVLKLLQSTGADRVTEVLQALGYTSEPATLTLPTLQKISTELS
jgi:predicted metal-dependent hydrolase